MRRGARVAANAGSSAASGVIPWIEENRAWSPPTRPLTCFWVLASFDAFDRLYTGRSRTAEEASRILVSTAERSLCR
jgi:hypothetical protein